MAHKLILTSFRFRADTRSISKLYPRAKVAGYVTYLEPLRPIFFTFEKFRQILQNIIASPAYV